MIRIDNNRTSLRRTCSFCKNEIQPFEDHLTISVGESYPEKKGHFHISCLKDKIDDILRLTNDNN